jgi:hypothetical protein
VIRGPIPCPGRHPCFCNRVCPIDVRAGSMSDCRADGILFVNNRRAQIKKDPLFIGEFSLGAAYPIRAERLRIFRSSFICAKSSSSMKSSGFWLLAARLLRDDLNVDGAHPISCQLLSRLSRINRHTLLRPDGVVITGTVSTGECAVKPSSSLFIADLAHQHILATSIPQHSLRHQMVHVYDPITLRPRDRHLPPAAIQAHIPAYLSGSPLAQVAPYLSGQYQPILIRFQAD